MWLTKHVIFTLTEILPAPLSVASLMECSHHHCLGNTGHALKIVRFYFTMCDVMDVIHHAVATKFGVWFKNHIQCAPDISRFTFSKYPTKNTHRSPYQASYGCLSRVPSLTEVLSSNLLCCVQYRVILYREISRVYSIACRFSHRLRYIRKLFVRYMTYTGCCFKSIPLYFNWFYR